MFPAPKALEFVHELHDLGRDDGGRLVEIISVLSAECDREPRNLIWRTHLQSAFARAGLVKEAHTEAQELLMLLKSVPAVTPSVQSSVASSLGASSYFEDAKRCLIPVFARELDEDDLLYAMKVATQLSVHSGELTWADHVLSSKSDVRRFIERHRLLDWWPAQQDAIQEILSSRTVQFGCEVVNLENDERLSLDYYTDAEDVELDALEDRVFQALDTVYADHPDGPGATIGRIVINIHGPEIPLPKGLQ